jgi:hypothetical protein
MTPFFSASWGFPIFLARALALARSAALKRKFADVVSRSRILQIRMAFSETTFPSCR